MASQQSTIRMSPNPTDLWHFDLTRFFLLSIAFGSIAFVILFGIAWCIVESVYKLSEIFVRDSDQNQNTKLINLSTQDKQGSRHSRPKAPETSSE